MGDWIDDRLRDLESWIYQGHDIPSDHSVTHVLFCDIPPLSRMVGDARNIYEFAVMHIPDSALLNDMAGTLAAIRDEAEKYASELNSSLDALAASWQGPAAEAYYAAPGFHVDQTTPGGTAYTLMQNLTTVHQGSVTNHQSHVTMASNFSDMQGHQTNLYESLGGLVIGLGATVAVGGVDFEVTGPAMAADAAWGVRVVQTIQSLIPAIEVAIDIRAIAGIAGVVLLTLTLVSIAGDSAGITVLQAKLISDPALTPEQVEAVNELFREFGGRISIKALQWLIGALGAGMAAETAKAIIRCLVANGYMDTLFGSAWNAVSDHLTPRDLQGAWAEKQGIDTGYDHEEEVSNAETSLKNLIANLDGRIADYRTPAALRALYQVMRSACQGTVSFIDKVVNGTVTPSKWDNGGEVPFFKDVLAGSPCGSATPAQYP